ncbi:hypothetical protein PISMIDRAFT_214311 [Pisolithus microcarpus 441]|uniref:Uncharacterized protein n=1 Tax=Pisolithus microcarpus 441 TaxID=765257 RepID=A0A0C9Z5I0_9AGAM|nr:hypothetical protein PISMIDRAFT_214311 [Pisolithus microcarpus 441]
MAQRKLLNPLETFRVLSTYRARLFKLRYKSKELADKDWNYISLSGVISGQCGLECLGCQPFLQNPPQKPGLNEGCAESSARLLLSEVTAMVSGKEDCQYFSAGRQGGS